MWRKTGIRLYLIPFFLLSCTTSNIGTVTPQQAMFTNYDRSEIREARFFRRGEGTSVTVSVEPLTRGNVTYTLERIITEGIYDFRDNRFVFNKVSFPFRVYILFYADFWEGSGPPERRRGEFLVEIKEKRNWDVKIYI